ncbi:hypothetical protein ACFL9T_17010 [Thermodesulfobacteriota bacterium]
MNKYVPFLALLILFRSKKAFGYIDPGTGSILAQAVIAVVVGALFTMKLYWKKLRKFFRKFLGKEPRRRTKS